MKDLKKSEVIENTLIISDPDDVQCNLPGNQVAPQEAAVYSDILTKLWEGNDISDNDVLPWTPYLSDIMLEGEVTHMQHGEDRLINEIATRVLI